MHVGEICTRDVVYRSLETSICGPSMATSAAAPKPHVRLQFFHLRDLRIDEHNVDADLASNALGGGAVVAGEHRRVIFVCVHQAGRRRAAFSSKGPVLLVH